MRDHRFDEVEHEQPKRLLVEAVLLLQNESVVEAEGQADDCVLRAIQQEEYDGDWDFAAVQPSDFISQILGQGLRLAPQPGQVEEGEQGQLEDMVEYAAEETEVPVHPTPIINLGCSAEFTMQVENL